MLAPGRSGVSVASPLREAVWIADKAFERLPIENRSVGGLAVWLEALDRNTGLAADFREGSD
jgi:hypothetical protein